MYPSDILPESITSKALLAITIAVIFVRFVTWLSDRKLHPPGPFCLPIVGYLPFLGKLPHETLHKLSQKYGGTFGLYLGNRYVVVLGSYKAMKEAFSKPELLFRPENPPLKLAERKISMSSSNGEHWKQQRKFILHQLKDLGLGKSIMEQHIKEEICHFLQEIDKARSAPVDFRNILLCSVINNIIPLVFGQRYESNDPRRAFLSNNLSVMLSSFSQTAVHCFMPWITPLLIRLGLLNYNKGRNAVGDIFRFVQEEITKREKNLDSSCVRDFVDGFLIKMKEQHISCNSSFTMDMLNGNIQSLLSAGSEPVVATIEWSLVMLAEYQEVQRKMQQEIDNIIGSERLPCWNDRFKMLYTQAIIMELQRCCSPTPINLLRCADKDTVIEGYKILKGTIVMANLWGIHKDQNCWQNPNEFNPDRFLNKERTVILKRDGYVPFSLGKRACPGEALANVETFLYITSIFQQYEVSFPEGCAHNIEGYSSVSFRPITRTLLFTERT